MKTLQLVIRVKIQYAMSIAEKLVGMQMVFAGVFGRECQVLGQGQFYKDLKYLNRDLKRVLVVENDPKHVIQHTENAIILPPYKGDQDDKALFELLPVLDHLSKPNVKDIREELLKYGTDDTAKKFNEELKLKAEAITQQKNKVPFNITLGNWKPFLRIFRKIPRKCSLFKEKLRRNFIKEMNWKVKKVLNSIR